MWNYVLGRLLFVTLSFGYGTKCNNIAVTTTNSSVILLCSTIFSVTIVIIMIGLILVTAPNAVQQLLLYFYFGLVLVTAPNGLPHSLFINHLCAHVVFRRSTGNDTIYPELLLTVRVIRWNKVTWVLPTQRQEELFVNNYQSFIIRCSDRIN